MTQPSKILAVDVCGTLYDANTTAGLAIFHHARMSHPVRHAFLCRISRKRGVLCAALILFAKLTGFDLHRHLVLTSLKGETLTSVEASASRYLADHLASKAIPASHERLFNMRSSGWQPILVSNAISPMIEAIARQLDLPFIASIPEVKNGRLTGRLTQDLTGRKRDVLWSQFDDLTDTSDFAVMTDNRTDSDLIKVADPAVLVSSGTPRNWMRKWNAEILIH